MLSRASVGPCIGRLPDSVRRKGGEGGPDFPDLTGKEGNFRKAAAVATRRAPRANQGPRKLAPQTSKIVRTRGRRKATGGPKIHNREVHSTKSKTSPRDVLLPGPERVKKPASWDTRGPPRTNPGSPTRAKEHQAGPAGRPPEGQKAATGSQNAPKSKMSLRDVLLPGPESSDKASREQRKRICSHNVCETQTYSCKYLRLFPCT